MAGVLNADTGANYASQFVYSLSSTAGASGVTGQTSFYAGSLETLASVNELDIPLYAGTTFPKVVIVKDLRFRSGASATNNASVYGGGVWNNTAAVTSIKFTLANMSTGTSFVIYGTN